MTMAEIRKIGQLKGLCPSIEGFCEKGEITPFVHALSEDDVSRIWGGDRRLSLFSYTIETINMLLLPMIKTKY
jgi:hypothetical protein